VLGSSLRISFLKQGNFDEFKFIDNNHYRWYFDDFRKKNRRKIIDFPFKHLKFRNFCFDEQQINFKQFFLFEQHTL